MLSALQKLLLLLKKCCSLYEVSKPVNNTPLISVVVPAYNLAAYLPRCLDSICSQTWRNIEIIVIDDGSTDDTYTIMKAAAAKDDRIQICHQANAGVTAARTAGIRIATGDYIGFVDGDDEIEPDMYERLINNALKYHADISHCGYQMCFTDGRINYFHNTNQLLQHSRQVAVTALLSGDMIEPGICNKLYRADLVKQVVAIMPDDIKINEDLLMNYYLFLRSEKSVFEDICPYHYIVRSGSATRQTLNQHRIYDPIKVKQLIIQSAPDWFEKKARAAYLTTCINVYNAIITSGSNAFASDRRSVRSTIRNARQWGCLISKKQQLLMNLILYAPAFYPFIYKIYSRFFRHNPYV